MSRGDGELSMKERPILFSGPMVRAILAGSKVQTRRAVKGWVPCEPENDGESDVWKIYNGDTVAFTLRCPYGVPGDRLRVKESTWMWCERQPNGRTATGRDKHLYVPLRSAPIHYAADHPQRPAIDVVSPDTGNPWGWRLKVGRFLPAWASRILLEITDVRVERLQDISEDDAIAEGMARDDAVHDYSCLWEQLNGAGSWAANPWVWALTFRRVEP